MRRCLESIKDAVDEICILFDGKPTDKTYDICKEYTNKLFIAKHLGEAEPHRPDGWAKTSHEWVLEIDPDEYASKELAHFLKNFNPPKDVGGYRFVWRQFYGDKPFKTKFFMKMYGKTALFKKSSVINENRTLRDSMQVKGKMLQLDYILEHQPPINRFDPKVNFKRHTKRARLIAQHFIDHKKVNLPAFLYIPKAFATFGIDFSRPYFSGAIWEGYKGFMFCVTRGLTSFYVNMSIYKILRGK